MTLKMLQSFISRPY